MKVLRELPKALYAYNYGSYYEQLDAEAYLREVHSTYGTVDINIIKDLLS